MAWRISSHRLAPALSGTRELISGTLHAAVTVAANGDSDAADGLKEFICLVVERCTDEQLARLREATRSAGFDLRTGDGGLRLLPLDEPHAPLSEGITALEADFERLGMSTASNHYRQAVDSLVDGRHEAANGQLRAAFEEVVAHLASLNGNSCSSHNHTEGWVAERTLLPR